MGVNGAGGAFAPPAHANHKAHFQTLLCHTPARYGRLPMSINVKLSEALVESARASAAVQRRSVAEQSEYWARLGKAADENPDLPVAMIRDILAADQEAASGIYSFSVKRAGA